jgi:hypothetical protein
MKEEMIYYCFFTIPHLHKWLCSLGTQRKRQRIGFKARRSFLLKICYIQNTADARCGCLVPVILATGEAEIRIAVQFQPRKIVLETPSPK